MRQRGFRRGQYNPRLYFNEKLRVKVLVHGDDFVSVGGRSMVRGFHKKLSTRFEIKTCIIGSRGDLGEVREGKVLNRIVRLADGGYELEADQRHAEMIVAGLDLTGCRFFPTQGNDQG